MMNEMRGAKGGELRGRYHMGMFIGRNVLYPRQNRAVCDGMEQRLQVGVFYGYITPDSFKPGDCRARGNSTYLPQM